MCEQAQSKCFVVLLQFVIAPFWLQQYRLQMRGYAIQNNSPPQPQESGSHTLKITSELTPLQHNAQRSELVRLVFYTAEDREGGNEAFLQCCGCRGKSANELHQTIQTNGLISRDWTRNVQHSFLHNTSQHQSLHKYHFWEFLPRQNQQDMLHFSKNLWLFLGADWSVASGLQETVEGI